MNPDFPILEFDPDPEAILNPQVEALKGKLLPRAVMCFFQDVLKDLLSQGKLSVVGQLRSEIGMNPVYTMKVDGTALTIVHAGDGASLAASFLDDLIAAGVRQVVACGGCGSLVEDIPAGHVMIPLSAVRDEGTSYHYLPPSRECYPSPEIVKSIEKTLNDADVPFIHVKTWTTDAVYRETESKRKKRIEEGCQVVEMEASALFAVAAFRKAEVGMLLYAGDLVVPEGWQEREWNQRSDSRELLFDLAVRTSLNLKKRETN